MNKRYRVTYTLAIEFDATDSDEAIDLAADCDYSDFTLVDVEAEEIEN